MYKLVVKDNVYTIPKSNLLLLALQKAMYVGYNKPLKTESHAIEFFNSIGVTVEEIK